MVDARELIVQGRTWVVINARLELTLEIRAAPEISGVAV